MDHCAKKEDFVFVAIARKLPYTSSKLWQMRSDELKTLVGDLTPDELLLCAAAQAARSSILGTIPELKSMLRSLGLSCPSGITKGGIQDMIKSAKSDTKRQDLSLELDPDQCLACEAAAAIPPGGQMVINAGPGAGKTTTVCRIAEILTRPGERVLMLAYNDAAHEIMLSRLTATGKVPLVRKDRIMDDKGCAVMTFDKFAYQARRIAGLSTATNTWGGFRASLEEGIVVLRENPGITGHWDTIIVDEAQDMEDRHASLCEAVCTKFTTRLILAGDPRQELYSGATWFSNKWVNTPAEGRHLLRYNHRSAPEIVSALNRYSKASFPSLHVDQLMPAAAAAAEPAGSVSIVWVDGSLRSHGTATQVGEQVACALADAQSDDVYAVVPVTLEKYFMEHITTAVRQFVHELKPTHTALATIDGESAAHRPNTYILATSKKIKGTERKVVVIYGADQDYSKTVDHKSLLKSLYVALSRAKERVIIVLRRGGNSAALQMLAPLTGIVCEPRRCAIRTKRRTEIPVAGQGMSLANTEVPVKVCHTRTAPRLCLPQLPHNNAADSDFMGCFAEALLAEALGVDLKSRPITVLPLEPGQRPSCSYDRGGNCYVVRVHAGEVRNCQELLLQAGPMTGAYAHTTAMYSALCGKLWTVSSRLSACATDLAASAASYLRESAPHESVLYQANYGRPVPIKRSTKQCVTHIAAVADLVLSCGGSTGTTVVEIKYCNVTTDTHRRQAAVYAALANKLDAQLYNLKNGTVETIEAMSVSVLEGCARALHFMQVSKEKAISGSPLIDTPAELKRGMLVFVDTEMINGHIVEVGAVALTPDGQLLDVIDRHATCVEPGERRHTTRSAKSYVEKLIGMVVDDAADIIASSAQLVNVVWAEWLARFPGATVIHWGGSEHTMAAGAGTYDASKLYRAWAERHLGSATKYSLETAVTAAVPELTHAWEPHRAIDDALAMAAVVTSITNRAGCV